MRITSKNYFSKEADKQYMSASQFKSFMKCEASAMAELEGDSDGEESQALFLGSLVDELLTGTKKTQEAFMEENHNKLYKKNGEPYADVTKAFNAVEEVKKQPLMMKYLTGRKQRIMTGTIAGVEFKIKMDCYKPGHFISDLKYLASLKSPNLYDNVVKYWGYDISMAIYQEVVYQNTGDRLPVYLVIVTKEATPRKCVCEIKQWNLDDALEVVKKNLPRIMAVKRGEVDAVRCGDCDYCAATQILTEIIDSDML